MSVWICIPSIRPRGGSLPAWKEAGYRVAVLRQGESLPFADIEISTDRYLGWAPSINLLVQEVMAQDSAAEWMVGGGDDTLPDAKRTPETIARECSEYFAGSFGVMQPTGDKQLWPASAIENFAGSPWMGREWCKRMYQGSGPLWPEYFHMFGDEELQCVAEKLGVFWQRPDLIHLHQHWAREAVKKAPAFLHYVNSPGHWESSKTLFLQRKAAGFPQHEPLAA
jgi:hypothetical protein